MSVKNQIVSTLLNILINVVSSDISNSKMSLTERYNFFQFKKNNKKWMVHFCEEHDGTVLTTGKFEQYLKYQHPIDKIFNCVLNPSREMLGFDNFINQMVSDAKDYLTSTDNNMPIHDELVLKELFQKIYWQLEEYCKKNLSLSEKYRLTTILNSNVQQTENIREDIKEVKELLKNKGVINDSEVIIKIYSTLNDDIFAGNIEDVYNILSLLEGNNSDINIAIRIKMSIISDCICLDKDIIEAWYQINSEYISEDVARFLILCWIESKEKLEKLYEKLENQDLKKIIHLLLNDDVEELINVETEIENHVNLMQYTVTNQFEKENWLVRRICAYWLYKQSIFNIYDAMKKLLESDMNFIDKFFIVEKELEEVVSVTTNGKIDIIKLNAIKGQLLEMKDKYCHANYQLKEKFFEMLIRTLVIADDEELENIIRDCPKKLKNVIKIKSLILQYKINRKAASEKEIWDVCEESEQYWLFNNYLCQFTTDTVKLQSIIENYPEVLKKDLGVFLMYIQAIKANEGKEKATVILEQYSDLYEECLEYWIEQIKLRRTECELVSKLYDKWEGGNLKVINLESEIVLAEILIDAQKYKEASQVIKKVETIRGEVPALLRLKAKVMLEEKQIVNALNILQKIFDDFAGDSFVVDTIIVLLLNSQREVPQKVIDAAINIGSNRLFMLVSAVYARKKKYGDAKYYITKSLLRTNDNNIDIYSSYFGQDVKLQDNSERNIVGVEEDTAVLLTSNSGEKRIYCIYRDDVLPAEPYFWENSTHIYRDMGISLGLFRKKTHDVVLIEEKEYEITEIMPIECYLFRVCMKKLVEAKTIKQFSIETRADGTINENKLISDLKEYMPESEATFDWLHNYKDLSNMPVTFHLLQRKVRVNATQLLILLMQDNNIIIREVYDEECIVGNLYVLTFASTVILYMLGIKPEYLNDKNVVISGSLQKTLISMCNEIIDENNNETVSSIGIVDNHLFMNIVTEQEKVTIMREAANLKQFALGFNKLDNFKDVEWEIADKINLLEILGIADYDALAIAQVKKAIVVTGEVLTMRLIQIKELGVNGTGIINFLIGIQMEIDDLLDCMKKMVGFRLLITLTKDSVIYLMERYNEIEEDDEKEQCMEKWIDYLSMPENMNEEYKDAFVQNLTEVYRRMYEQQRENVNPIWSNFVFFLMKYNHIKLKVSIEKDGNIEVAVHRDLE